MRNLTRVLLVDDHEGVRTAIRALLSTDPTVTICGEAANGREAIEQAQASRPELVIMDVTMPTMNGLEATAHIKRLLPKTEVIILSQYDGAGMIREAHAAGATAYVTKSRTTDLIEAVKKLRPQGSDAADSADQPHSAISVATTTETPTTTANIAQSELPSEDFA